MKPNEPLDPKHFLTVASGLWKREVTLRPTGQKPQPHPPAVHCPWCDKHVAPNPHAPYCDEHCAARDERYRQ